MEHDQKLFDYVCTAYIKETSKYINYEQDKAALSSGKTFDK